MMMRVHGDIIITRQKIIFTTKSKQNHCPVPAAETPANWKGQRRRTVSWEKSWKISVLSEFWQEAGWFLCQLLISELKSISVNFQFSQNSRFLCLCYKPKWDGWAHLEWKLFQWNSEKSLCKKSLLCALKPNEDRSNGIISHFNHNSNPNVICLFRSSLQLQQFLLTKKTCPSAAPATLCNPRSHNNRHPTPSLDPHEKIF